MATPLRYDILFRTLPKDMLDEFNKMNMTGRQYTANRVLGMSRADAYIATGSQVKSRDGARSVSSSLEARNPIIQKILDYCANNNIAKELLDPNSEFNKAVEAEAKKAQEAEQQKVEKETNALFKAKANEVVEPNAEAKMQQLQLAQNSMTPDFAQSIQFYRDIVNGKTRSYKTIKTYDADGKLIGKRIEETSDIATKMQAREKLDKMLGLNALQQLGQVQIGSIAIKIMDTSKHEDENNIDVQDAVITNTDEIVLEQEVEEHKPKVKEEKLPLYYTNEKGERRRRPSWQRTIEKHK